MTLLSVFSVNFEINCAQNSHLTKTDLIKYMELLSMEGYLSIDRNSMFALRLNPEKHNIGGSTISQLFGKCSSKIGNALLAQYLLRPLIKLDEIQARHRAVSKFIGEIGTGKKNSVVEQINDCIGGISDINVVIHKLKLGNYEAQIWKQLQNIFYNFIKLKELIESSPILRIIECCVKFIESFEIGNIRKLQEILTDVIDFNTDLDNLCIQNCFDATLQNYKDLYDEMEQILSEKASRLRRLTGLDLMIAYIPQFGYLVAIEKQYIMSHSLESFDLVFTTSTTYYYKDQNMLEMDTNYGDLYSLIRDKEIEILYNLQTSLFAYGLENLVIGYQFIGEMDVFIRFALVSYENNFCKPEMFEDEPGVIELQESFHPLFGVSNFISNDFKVSNSKVIVITGPNYSGKSTLLAQIGIAIYLAQIGCFIPAKFGRLSVFKKILTRINTMESINITQSTFMKDCQQMHECISKSTVDSLVLIDEFGKGTDVNDGPALLGSTVKYFLNQGVDCPVVVLSTHMIELFNEEILGEVVADIDFKQMKIMIENNNRFKMTFLYQLAPGLATDSAGLFCAKKSGIDSAIIERADFILQLLKQGQNIVGEFASLDENEMKMIGEHKNKIKRFLELNFQEWPMKDNSKLKAELLKILHN